MSLYDVLGQSQIAELLLNSIKHQRVAHAYIFAGSKGVGTKKMAIEFAKAINCESGSADACDQCNNCKRIEHHNHPDVLWVEPDGNSIKIEQIRQLQREFHFKTVESKVKVLVIDHADKMTKEAANSLLKFIEEPKSPLLAILLVENPHNLLSTILSRCQLIHFPHLDSESIIEVLKSEGFRENDIRIAANVTEDLEDVKTLLGDEQFAQMRNLVVQWNEEIPSKNFQTLFSIQGNIMKNNYIKENIPIFLDLLFMWYHDILSLKLNRTHMIIYRDFIENIKKQAIHVKEDQIIAAMEKIISTKKKLTAHVNTQLVLEQLVLSLWEG